MLNLRRVSSAETAEAADELPHRDKGLMSMCGYGSAACLRRAMGNRTQVVTWISWLRQQQKVHDLQGETSADLFCFSLPHASVFWVLLPTNEHGTCSVIEFCRMQGKSVIPNHVSLRSSGDCKIDEDLGIRKVSPSLRVHHQKGRKGSISKRWGMRTVRVSFTGSNCVTHGNM